MAIFKRGLSFFLSVVLAFSMMPAIAQAEEEPQAQVDSGDVTVEGTNSVGTLLSEEIQEYQEADETAGGYNVVGLTVENGVATAEFRTLEAAILMVAVYAEDGFKLLASGRADVQPEDSTVSVTLGGTVPEYFIASAYLVDIYDYSPLCSAYETVMYTREMQELLASTVDDYDPDLVLNLDDSTETNFAVYEESVIRIVEQEGVNTVVTADREAAAYVFENADETMTSLKQGDIFAYAYGEADVLLVKVAAISVTGTTVTITGGQLEIDEVFSHLKLESDGSTADVTVDESTAGDGITYEGEYGAEAYALRSKDTIDETVSKRFSIECTIENGEDEEVSAEAKLSGYLDMRLNLLVDYYLTVSQQQLTCKITFTGEFNVNLSGQISTSLDLPKLGYEPVKGVLFLGFAPKVNVQFEGEMDFTANLTATAGFSYNGGEGFKCLNTAPRFTAGYELKASVYVGLDLAPNLRLEIPCEGDKSIELLTVEFTTEVGVEVAAQLIGSIIDTGSSQETKLHDCKNCLAVTVTGKLQFNASLNILELFKPETDFDPIEKELIECYYSYDYNDVGQGECPHYTYRVTVQVKNEAGSNVSGAAVTAGEESWGSTNANGVLVKYLPAGSYAVTAVYSGTEGKTTVTVSEPVSVPVTLGKTASVGGLGSVTANTVKDKSAVIASGYYTCYWELTANGTLYVTGAGVSDGHTPPWGKYSNMITSLVIGENVNYLGMHAFRGLSKLTNVTFGPDVQGIGWETFYDCDSLKEIHIPDTVAFMNRGAFGYCDNLEKIYFGSNLQNNGEMGLAFQACNKLIGIYVDADNPNMMDVDGVLYNKTQTELIYCPSGYKGHFVIPDGVTSIGAYAFYRYGACKNMTAVTIPESVTYIGGRAFCYNEGLREIFFSGDVPDSIDNICVCLVTATAYYPAGNDTWTADKLQNYRGTLTWVAYDPAVGVTAETKKPATRAIYGGEYDTEVTDSYTLKTASFSNLVPGEEYLLLALVSLEAEEPLAADNLLAIDQGQAEEDGTLVFEYVQRVDTAISYVMVCGASNKNLLDAEIEFPYMNKTEEVKAVDPVVTYDGTVLTEGVDYTIVGTVDYTVAGTFTCYVRGIYNYTGLVECTYTVADASLTETEDYLYLTLNADCQTVPELTKDLYVDLNGFDLIGTVTTNGYKIYGMDSTTDNYTCEAIGYMNLVDESGNEIVPETHFKSDITGSTMRYMSIKDDNGYSFHRFYMGITHQTLKPTTTGVGYKAVFYGDSMIVENLDSFGFTMTLGNYTPKTFTKTADGFVSGKTITLRIDNYDVENHGETNLCASVMLKLLDGTVIESTQCSMTMRNLLETLNTNYTDFEADQLTAVAEMIEKYAIIQSWQVENLI